jgi:hypothetical protein
VPMKRCNALPYQKNLQKLEKTVDEDYNYGCKNLLYVIHTYIHT